VRIGLVGIVVIEPLVYRRPPFGAQLEEPNGAALREAARLVREERCTCVLALTHQSADADRALARAQEGTIPLVLGGHEHTPLDETIAGARVLKAGTEASHAIIVDVTFDDAGKIAIDARRVPVADYAEDPALRALVDTHMRPVHALERATLLVLPPGQELSSIGVRVRQTSVGTLVCSRLRDVLGAEACIFNGGGIRAGRAYEGRFTYGDLEAELPFDNEIAVASLPGAVVLDAIRASRAHAPVESGAFLQIDDRIELDETGGEIRRMAGAPFEPDRMYRVALVRDLFSGLDRIEPLSTPRRSHPRAVIARRASSSCARSPKSCGSNSVASMRSTPITTAA
jgi:2',3'-cyclic-nucleotide 2'-phosphodiesterase (5'-nucleotidase family)